MIQHAPELGLSQSILSQLLADQPDSAILPLQPDGSRVPVFCLPRFGGDVLPFHSLVPALGQDQPLYALDFPDFSEGKSVRSVASKLAEDLRRFHPAGPYYLAGYSTGGLLAYEIAHQLRAAGREVPLLVLLDVFGPGYPRALRPGPSMLLRHAAARLRRRGGMIDGPYPVGAWDAAREYDFPKYPGRVALFRCTVVPAEDPRHEFDDILNGWGTAVQTSIELHPVPCTHAGLTDPRHARLWVPQFRDLLARVQSR